MAFSKEELQKLRDTVLDPATDRETYEDTLARLRQLEAVE